MLVICYFNHVILVILLIMIILYTYSYYDFYYCHFITFMFILILIIIAMIFTIILLIIVMNIMMLLIVLITTIVISISFIYMFVKLLLLKFCCKQGFRSQPMQEWLLNFVTSNPAGVGHELAERTIDYQNHHFCRFLSYIQSYMSHGPNSLWGEIYTYIHTHIWGVI